MMFNKDESAELGLFLADAFIESNPNIKSGKITIEMHKRGDRQYDTIQNAGTCGYYRRGVIHVATDLCAHQSPLYSWQSYISDRTPYGVIQHELGHHVDQVMSGFDIYRHNGQKELYSTKIRKKTNSPKITSYCPNDSEWFAEMFRLFVTNPDLLKLKRPMVYAALIGDGFFPIIKTNYKETLDLFKAPQNIFDRLEKFAAK